MATPKKPADPHLPKFFTVGHLTIQVRDYDLARASILGEFIPGTENPDHVTLIDIDERVLGDGPEIASTFLHELLHACAHVYIADDQSPLKSQKEWEELFVDGCSKGLVQVIRDHPDIWEWLKFMAEKKP